jgi:hypothetical protein
MEASLEGGAAPKTREGSPISHNRLWVRSGSYSKRSEAIGTDRRGQEKTKESIICSTNIRQTVSLRALRRGCPEERSCASLESHPVALVGTTVRGNRPRNRTQNPVVLSMIVAAVASLGSLVRTRRDLALEILALRQ